MKQNFLFKQLFLITLVFISSCQEDDILDKEIVTAAEEQVGNFTFKDMKGSEIYNDDVIVSLLKESSAKNSLNVTKKSEHGFVLDTTSVNYFEVGDYHSYTFNVIPEVAFNGFQNIVYISQKNGTYAEYLYTYNLTLEEQKLLENNNYINLEGKATKTLLSISNVINFSSKEASTAKSSTDICVYEYWKDKDSNGGYAYENKESCEGENGVGGCEFKQITVACPEVITDNGGSSGGTTADSGGDNGFIFIIYDAPITGGGGLGFADGDGNIGGPNGGGGGMTSPIVRTVAYEVRTQIGIYNVDPAALWLEQNHDIAKSLLDYLEENKTSNGQVPYALKEFLKEVIAFHMEIDWKKELKQAIANGITSTAEVTHKIYKKLDELGSEYPQYKEYITIAVDELREVVDDLIDKNPSTATWADLFNMWLFEKGPDPINFNNSSATTQSLKNQEGVNTARAIAIQQIQNNNFSPVNHPWSFGQTEAYDTVANGNLVTAFLGSYSTKVTITQTLGGPKLTFTITNTSGWESATRFRIDNDGNGHHDGVFPNKPRGGDIKLGGNFKQKWTWTENP